VRRAFASRRRTTYNIAVPTIEEQRDSAPPVASAPQPAEVAPGPAAAALGLYTRALVVRVAVLALGLAVLLAAQRWTFPAMRVAITVDGMTAALTAVVMMVGLNRFARAEEDARAGGLAIFAVLLLLGGLVADLYATKLRLDMAAESADVVLVYRALHALPWAQTASRALGIGAALLVVGALRRAAARAGDAALARRGGRVAALLGVLAAGVLLAPLATRGVESGAFAYDMILVGATALGIGSYLAFLFAARRTVGRRAAALRPPPPAAGAA
jgi:hypothetical protein